jgi:uncharacterized protein
MPGGLGQDTTGPGAAMGKILFFYEPEKSLCYYQDHHHLIQYPAMELNQEFIDGLTVNEVALMKRIAEQLAVTMGQVSAVISLLEEGSTVPFIARYRKEKTGSLDELQVRDVGHLFASGKNLETRRLEIIRGIFEQGKLTEPLYENIVKAATLTELEDIYAPYKRKKKTRGMIALEKGLEPLAEAMLS